MTAEDSKRESERRRMLKGVSISYNGGFTSNQAILKNISENGAMLQVSEGIVVPDQFVLVNDLDGYRVECVVRRRTGLTVGIEFVSEIEKFQARRSQSINMINVDRVVQLTAKDEADWDKDRIEEIRSKRRNAEAKPAFGKRA